MRHKKKTKAAPRSAAIEREREPVRNRRFNRLWVVAAVPVLLFAVFSVYRVLKRPSSRAASHAAESVDNSRGYVDPQVCSTCHGDIAASFHRTGMGRSLYRPAGSNRIEDYTRKNSIYNRRSD